ncbi:hypothetical protein Fot_03755 [Forsythia ovata]|uniref:Uncharacterized protein n=1 Tax=Forsythia ovata TaxID=205694 RepID=A0ABD1XAK9_9LAMI
MEKKRVRDDSFELDEETNSTEVKRLKEDLLETLEDDPDFVSTNLDLESFMRSFQDEIGGSPPLDVVDLTSDSGESQPELGYLLEASDDELGLPPSTASPSVVENDGLTELARVEADSSELGRGFWGFDGEFSSYNSLEFGLVESENYNNSNTEYVELDGLFDYSDLDFGSNDFVFRPEISPAQ